MSRGPFKQVGSVLLPSGYPDLVGLGCPKCDDHELVSTSAAVGPPASQSVIAKFVKRHADCGALEQLEKHGDELRVTGYVNPGAS